MTPGHALRLRPLTTREFLGMTDAAVASIVTGCVTITTLVVGFLTMWFKLRYGVAKVEEAAVNAQRVEGKVDTNTHITTQAKDAAVKAGEHAAACDEERTKLLTAIAEHDGRIGALESQMALLRTSIDAVKADVASTRHELRGHLQTITNSLQVLTLAQGGRSLPPLVPAQGQPQG